VGNQGVIKADHDCNQPVISCLEDDRQNVFANGFYDCGSARFRAIEISIALLIKLFARFRVTCFPEKLSEISSGAPSVTKAPTRKLVPRRSAGSGGLCQQADASCSLPAWASNHEVVQSSPKRGGRSGSTLSSPPLRTNSRVARRRFCRLGVAAVCAFLGLGFSPAAAQSWLPLQQHGGNLGGLLPAAPREPAGHVVSRTAHPAVARIVVQEKSAISYGSGSLVEVRGEYGLLVTNWHVVRDAAGGSIYAFFPEGFQTPATIVKADRDWDLAALSIRRPPNVQPIAIARTAPQIGEWLCIAGYGSGDYRAAAGRCTQYVSPATNLPFEMVEVAAEARQGDSGGPIFNERLELAGVLFGAANGTTSGSYAGRVNGFLQSLMQPAASAQHQPAYSQQLAQQQAEAPVSIPTTTDLPSAPSPAADAHLFAAAPPPSPSNPPPLSIDTVVPLTEQARAAVRNLTDVSHAQAPRPLMPLPERNALPLTLVTGEEPLQEDRTALRPTPSRGMDGRDLSLPARDEGPIAAEALNVAHALPSRVPLATPLETAPADQLIAAAWKQIGGSTLFDQGKTLLAVLGLLGLLIQFWRMNSRPDVDDD